MIVRIMGDNQYRVDDQHAPEIERLDDDLMKTVDASDHARFDAALRALIEHVRLSGQLVPNEELVPSDMMIPAPDMSLDEAREMLAKATIHEQGNVGA